MGLDRQVPLRRQLSQGGHQLVGAGGGEAGGQNGLDQLEPAVFQPAEGFGYGLPRLLLGGAGVAVHVYLSHIPRHPGPLQLLHEDQGGVGVPGGEHGHSGSAGGDEVRSQLPVDPPGVGRILEPGLRAEGIGVQPLQQRQIHAHAHHDVLGGVEVQVREGGHDEALPVVRHRTAGAGLRQDREQAPDHAVLQNEVAVGDGFQRPEGGGVEQVSV